MSEQKSRLLEIVSSLHWNASSVRGKPNGILVNLNLANGVLNEMKWILLVNVVIAFMKVYNGRHLGF